MAPSDRRGARPTSVLPRRERASPPAGGAAGCRRRPRSLGSPQLCRQKMPLREWRSPSASAAPARAQARGTERDCRPTALPRGPRHPECPLPGLSPEEANINRRKHVKLNGLLRFPTAAIVTHHGLPDCNIAGQPAVRACSDRSG